MPKPAAHVLQLAQSSLPAVVLNCPVAHTAHTRSDEAEGAMLRYSPASHAALTGVHVEPSMVSENVVPALQAAHTRSAVVEPAVACPWPAGHVRHAAHAWLPAVALNVPSASPCQVPLRNTASPSGRIPRQCVSAPSGYS